MSSGMSPVITRCRLRTCNLVRVLLLGRTLLIVVYYFIRVTLFPNWCGAAGRTLVMHMWVAMIYRANRSVKLVLLANAASGVAAAIMTAFFAYALVTVQGPQTLLDRVGVFYTVSLLRSWRRSRWRFCSRCSIIGGS